MKVFFKIIFTVVIFLSFSFSSVYAKGGKPKSNDGWFLVGYAYTFPDSSSMDGLQGPATITVGGDLWKFIGLEVTLGGRWATQDVNYYDYRGSLVATDERLLWSFDIKPYLMLQPKIGVDMISLRPYVGIGPSFHFTGINSALDLVGQSYDSDTSFDVGFSAKAGLRLQAVKFLFVGVGAEYLYHKAKLDDINYDFSGWTVGAEIGFIW